jgi:hypothetical protein
MTPLHLAVLNNQKEAIEFALGEYQNLFDLDVKGGP